MAEKDKILSWIKKIRLYKNGGNSILRGCRVASKWGTLRPESDLTSRRGLFSPFSGIYQGLARDHTDRDSQLWYLPVFPGLVEVPPHQETEDLSGGY